jgi:hypothetical protein
LYFHVSDQLREFVSRLSLFRIKITVFNADAVALARAIVRDEHSALGVPPSTRFDRIDVSNIMDTNYVGIERVIEAWGRFLKRDNYPRMIGYFMNWVGEQADGEPGPEELGILFGQLISSKKVAPLVLLRSQFS